jgi:sec-independent protein translocase protein TatB
MAAGTMLRTCLQASAKPAKSSNCLAALPLLQPLRYDGLMSFADTVVLFVLALLLFGPKKLPGIARQVGKMLNEFKRASNEFKAQIESEISQLEYQERQKKEKEQEQKILPPAAPPPDSVQSPPYSSQPEPAQNPDHNAAELTSAPAANEVSSVASSNITNA